MWSNYTHNFLCILFYITHVSVCIGQFRAVSLSKQCCLYRLYRTQGLGAHIVLDPHYPIYVRATQNIVKLMIIIGPIGNRLFITSISDDALSLS